MRGTLLPVRLLGDPDAEQRTVSIIINLTHSLAATPPNAKSKRNLQVSEGAQNYKITCRAEGNPSPNITWYKDNQEITSDMKGIHVKFRR